MKKVQRKMSTRIQKCPRCNSKYIINFKDTIECLKCQLEFFKIDVNNIDDKSSVLSIQEKMRIISEFKDIKNLNVNNNS